jgi:peptide/nickel transport system substrate-binding protein
LNPGINRQELVDTVLSDQFNPATSILAATTPGYADQSGLLAFDPEAAQTILEEAGWVTGGDGIREKDGKKLSFSVVYAQLFSGNQAVLELTQQQLRAIGVDLQLKQATPAEQAEILASGDYEAYYYNSTRAEGDVLRTSFHAGLRNIAQREADDALEPVLEASLAEADSAKRNELLGQAQELIIENAYAIPLFELSQSIGVAGNVHGLGFEASSRLKFYDTWIAEQ